MTAIAKADLHTPHLLLIVSTHLAIILLLIFTLGSFPELKSAQFLLDPFNCNIQIHGTFSEYNPRPLIVYKACFIKVRLKKLLFMRDVRALPFFNIVVDFGHRHLSRQFTTGLAADQLKIAI